MYNLLSWDELCVVHAIADLGTLSGATRALHVSHPTPFRRLNRLEMKMGVHFFDRAVSARGPARTWSRNRQALGPRFVLVMWKCWQRRPRFGRQHVLIRNR